MNLQKIKDQLQTIFDAVPALIFYKDLENRLIKVNRHFRDSFGFKSYMDIVGHKCSEFFEDNGQFAKDDKQVIDSGEPLKVTEHITLKGQDKVEWYETTKIPYLDAEGNTIGVIGFSVNISKYIHTKNRLESLIDNIEDTFVIAEPKKDGPGYAFVHGNKRWKTMVVEVEVAKLLLSIQPFIDSVFKTKKTIELKDCHIASTIDSDPHYYNFLFYRYNGGIAILGRQVYNTPSQLQVRNSQAQAEMQLRLDRHSEKRKKGSLNEFSTIS